MFPPLKVYCQFSKSSNGYSSAVPRSQRAEIVYSTVRARLTYRRSRPAKISALLRRFLSGSFARSCCDITVTWLPFSVFSLFISAAFKSLYETGALFSTFTTWSTSSNSLKRWFALFREVTRWSRCKIIDPILPLNPSLLWKAFWASSVSERWPESAVGSEQSTCTGIDGDGSASTGQTFPRIADVMVCWLVGESTGTFKLCCNPGRKCHRSVPLARRRPRARPRELIVVPIG